MNRNVHISEFEAKVAKEKIIKNADQIGKLLGEVIK